MAFFKDSYKVAGEGFLGVLDGFIYRTAKCLAAGKIRKLYPVGFVFVMEYCRVNK